VVKRPRIILWTILVVAVVGLASAIAAPKVIPVGNRKFDHDQHAASASSASDPKRRTAECTTCHIMDAKGLRVNAKEHTNRCVKCHNDPKVCTSEMKQPGPKAGARRCQVCHVPTPGNTCKPPDLPPLPRNDSFEARYSHGKHIGFGASVEKDCGTCHREQASSDANPSTVGVHKQCTDCHNGPSGRSKLQFNDCKGCHGAPKGKTAAAADPYRLANFDHRNHHKTSNQSSCTTCHTKLAGAGDAAIPRPAMTSCLAACHDGQKAFSATGTKCTTCHKGSGQVTPTRTDLAFSHAAHTGRNVNIAKCDTCHSISPEGILDPPNAGKNHMPCATSGCHQTEFVTKTNKICGICHDAAMPWQKTVARAVVPLKPEWFEAMNHASHLAKKGISNAACSDCHGDKLGGGKKPQGHAACAECHGKGQGFPMSQCQTCHVQQAPKRGAVTEWSVAATFAHAKHAIDPRSKKVTACVECHATVKNAKDLATIQKPKMSQCDSCHNGKQSFKTTGFECSRCHSAPAAPAAPAAPTPTAFEDPDPTLPWRDRASVEVTNEVFTAPDTQAMLDLGLSSGESR